MLHMRSQIHIDTNQVLRILGYRNGCNPSARLLSIVNNYVEKARELFKASYSYTISDIKLIEGPQVFIENSLVFESKVIAQLLKHCEKVAIFLLTLGNRLDETMRDLVENDLTLEAVVLDAVGTDGVERLAEFVQGRITAIAKAQGYFISRRFSPGYCDWALPQQEMVFRAIDGDSPDIRLTEGFMMIPQKSISGIIGLGSSEVKDYNPCRDCTEEDCPGREI
jgi:hypothetical protein